MHRKRNRATWTVTDDGPFSRSPAHVKLQAQARSGRAGSLPVGHLPYKPKTAPLPYTPKPTPKPLMPIGSMVVEDGDGGDPASQEIVPEPESSGGSPSPGESAEISMPDDPPSGMSAGGYGSSCDGLACGGECAERSELLSLRAEVGAQLREMRHLQEQNYILLNASLQENFQATGALEGRLENYAARGDAGPVSGPGHSSRILMWTVLDAVSAILLWLITALIAKPYDAVKGALSSSQTNSKHPSVPSTPRGELGNDFWTSRKSWRLEASGMIPDFVHETPPASSKTRRRSHMKSSESGHSH